MRPGKLLRYLVAGLALAIVTGDVDFAGQQANIGFFKLVSSAEAVVVRRPARPVSAAGVARRTTRRIVRRGAYVAAVPAGCVYGTYYGYKLYYCGGVYYQASGSGYVIVYF
jgi:hypothetical protein